MKKKPVKSKPVEQSIKLSKSYTYVRRYLDCRSCKVIEGITEDLFFLILQGDQPTGLVCEACGSDKLTLGEDVGKVLPRS